MKNQTKVQQCSSQRKRKIFASKGAGECRRKRKKISEKENIWSEKQKKIGGGKEGKYFERTNIWFKIGKN